MIQSMGRRLRVVFNRTETDDVDPASIALDAHHLALPVLDFVAYAEDCVLFGRVRLAAERLTDMLNEHDEVLLIDVMAERLDGGGAIEVKEVLVKRDEILLVHATGPRGSVSRRQRTRQHPIAVVLGPYEVRGYLHALPGADPLASLRRRKPMVPLTEAWIEYAIGAVRQRRRVGAVVINREQIDVITHALDEEIELPDMPIGAEQGPLVKDFTGSILIADPGTA